MSENIFFRKFGNGFPVVLLHGFPMNQNVWGKFAENLSKFYAVYTPDLPGFGQSPPLKGEITLPGVASILNSWIRDLKIFPSAIIGHSMGGYVAIEMVKSAPDLFKGLGLLNSTAKEDAPEKKDSRTKVIGFIDDNGVLAFTSNFIQPLFANENHPAIPIVREITMQSDAEAVKGYTRAMRDRKENTDVLKRFKGPVLLVGGDKDKAIAVESLEEQGKLNPNTSLHIFRETGHMSMFEKPEETLQAVRTFLTKIDQPKGA
jgi:pimeloyl-ACP methyl ester carboxylesterase